MKRERQREQDREQERESKKERERERERKRERERERALQILLENFDFPLQANVAIAANCIMSDLTDYIFSKNCGYQPYLGVTICEG